MSKLGLTIAAAVIGTPVSFGGAFTAVQWLDGRYAPLSAVEDLAWSSMRSDIRALQQRIQEAQNPVLKAELERDLEELLARFCKSYPDDRLCKA